MKIISTLMGCMLMAIMASAQGYPKDIKNHFKFSNEEYNFGNIAFAKPVHYEVTVTNIGKDTACLENVTPSCGCTTPVFSKGEKIAPGDSIKIALGFNAIGKGGFRRKVTILLKEDKEYVMAIFFHGTILDEKTATTK